MRFAIVIYLIFSFSQFLNASESKELPLPDFSKVNDQTKKSAIFKVEKHCKSLDGRKIPSDSPEFQNCVQKSNHSAYGKPGRVTSGQ